MNTIPNEYAKSIFCFKLHKLQVEKLIRVEIR